MFPWSDTSALELGGLGLLGIDRSQMMRRRRPAWLMPPEEQWAEQQNAALGMGLPEVPGGLGAAETASQRMANTRVKKIFGVAVPDRRATRSILGGLANMPKIEAGGGFGNFLAGFQGGLGGALQAGDAYDEAQIDQGYKQAMIDKMTNPGKTDQERDFEARIKALKAIGYSDEEATKRVLGIIKDEEPAQDIGVVDPSFTGPLAPGQIRAPEGLPKGGYENYAKSLGTSMAKPDDDDETWFTLSPEAKRAAALRYATSGTLPSFGAREMGVRAKFDIANMASELFPTLDIESNKADLMANRTSLSKLTSQADAVQAFENTVENNKKVMLEALEGIKDTGTRAGNRLLRATQGQLGDPNIVKFNTALRAIQNEYARIITQPNLTGQLTDTARHEVEELLKGDFTKEQVLSAVDVLTRDAQNRRQSFDKQLGDVRARLSWNERLANPPKEEVYTRDPATGKLVRVQ